MKIVSAITAVLLLATVCQATTWHVAKDGTGDFTVIQDAVDAASDGDVIWIHAGRYDEIQHDVPLFGDEYAFRADTHVAIWKDNLTLRGDGPDVTIIGSEETPPPPPTYRQYGIGVTHFFASSLTIQDLRIEHTRTGVYAVNPEITVEGCEFTEIVNQGLFLNLQTEAILQGCHFAGIGAWGAVSHDVENIAVRDCSFDDSDGGVAFAATTNAVVESCTFVGGYVGVQYEQSAQGIVRDCVFTECSNYGLVVALGAQTAFTDCEFSGGACGIWVLDQGSSATGAGNLFTGHTYTTIRLTHGQLELHDSDIINGGGYGVLYAGTAMDPYHADLTNNYWGTDDANQIAEWIWDAVDDPDLSCTVDYIPFEGVVAIESRTWSDVKSMFKESK